MEKLIDTAKEIGQYNRLINLQLKIPDISLISLLREDIDNKEKAKKFRNMLLRKYFKILVETKQGEEWLESIVIFVEALYNATERETKWRKAKTFEELMTKKDKLNNMIHLYRVDVFTWRVKEWFAIIHVKTSELFEHKIPIFTEIQDEEEIRKEYNIKKIVQLNTNLKTGYKTTITTRHNYLDGY